MRRLALFAICSALSACCTTTPMQTDGQVSAEDVMRRVKDELSEYYFYMHQHENDPALKNGCSARVEFIIKSVTVTLTSQSDDTGDVNASATLPVGAAGTFGPLIDSSKEIKSTQTMKYIFYPVDPGSARPELQTSSKWTGFPIASSIEQLRESILKAGDTKPCIVFSPPPDPSDPTKIQPPSDQSATFDFNVVRTLKGGATFKFVLFSVGATGSKQRLTGNNVVVVFNAAVGGQAVRF